MRARAVLFAFAPHVTRNEHYFIELLLEIAPTFCYVSPHFSNFNKKLSASQNHQKFEYSNTFTVPKMHKEFTNLIFLKLSY